MEFQNHILTWAASGLCCLSMLLLACTSIESAKPVYQSNLFLPTYFVGIISWLLHGLELNSLAIIVTCSIQLPVIIFLLKRAINLRYEAVNRGL